MDDLVPLEGEILEPDDPHAVTRTDYPSGTAWRCACGRWEAFATGPSSATWAGRDHTRHREKEQQRG